MELSPEWVAAVTSGRIDGTVSAAPGPIGHGVGFDSRRLAPGEVFVALDGERDGHEFVTAARAAGAPFVVVSRAVDDGPAVVVPDVARALTDLARAGRSRLAARVVGITGSVGKTSTKDLAAGALGAGARTHAAPESFNNEIGVPITVLGAPDDTEVLVVEMGARFVGNIAELCALTEPEVGIITNIGISHVEHLGGREGVARAKGELLETLPAHGLAVINADCDASTGQRPRTAARVLTVGSDPSADVRITDLALDDELRPALTLETPWGRTAVRLRMRGAHQAVNAGQAAAAALHLGVSLDRVAVGLGGATGSAWRMELTGEPTGVRVLNDSYNASPASVAAALDALAAIPATGRRIAVLGEMRELGPDAEAEHERVGRHAAALGIDLVVAVGEATSGLAAAVADAGGMVETAADASAAAARLAALVAPGDVILVKASRAVGLERVAALIAEAAA